MKRRRPTLWVGCLAAGVVISLTAIVYLASRPEPYRRYVSPPLPDGTRFTFRYPAALGNPRTVPVHWGPRPGGPFLLRVRVSGTPSVLGRVAVRLPFLRSVFPGPDTEEVEMTALCLPPPLSHVAPDATGALTTVQGRFTRTEYSDLTVAAGVHQVELRRAGRSELCYIDHRYLDRLSRESFDGRDGAIMSSFRALPAGTPAPTP